MIRFTLYSRSWCHLCEDMLHALKAYPVGQPHAIDVIDVDADPALVELYDELVPVLTASRAGEPARQICHYHLDAVRLAGFLSGQD